MIHIIFMQYQNIQQPLLPYGWGGIVILEETTPHQIEMFHQRMKVITQNNCVLICSDPSL